MRFLFFLFFFSFFGNFIYSQTILSPGDIVMIGYKTSGSSNNNLDQVKLLTLVDLTCNTQFIVTDNNWSRATNTWVCDNDEFALQITVTSTYSQQEVFSLSMLKILMTL
jgi:hypothetical protein